MAFDVDKNGHWFKPLEIEPTELGDNVNATYGAPIPEGEMLQRVAAFMQECDPAVLAHLIGHNYPNPASFVN